MNDEEPDIPLEEKTIYCATCKKMIAEVVTLGITDTISKYKFQCPECQDTTFILKYKGRTSVSIPDEYLILDVEYNPESQLQYFKLGKRNG